jgi:CDP-paratose 2-epimerase
MANAHPDWEISAIDNLSRRGSELNLLQLHDAGVVLRHGDVRMLDDLLGVGIDALIECSAEPSALAGIDGAPD